MTALGWNPRRDWLFLRGNRSNQFLQLAVREPALVGVAGIAEAFRQWPALHPVLTPPPGMRWLNNVAVVHFQRIPRFVFRDQHFMQLFSGTNSDGLDLAPRRNRLRQVNQPHTGN